MNMTAACFVDMLKNSYRIEKIGDFPDDFPVERGSLWTGGVVAPESLYLSVGHEPIHGTKPLYIVTHGKCGEGEGWYLHCEPGEVLSVVNEFFYIWQAFHQWRERCRDLARIGHNLPALLDAGAEYLGADMIIIDREYRYDGGSLSGTFESNDFFSAGEDMDAKAVEELYVVNPRFDDTFRTDGLIPYEYPNDPDHALYYYNLRYDSLYLGRLLVQSPREKDTLFFRHRRDCSRYVTQ